MKPDLFEAPDYYNLDELLTEEHKLVRDAAREWVKRDVSPIIEEYAQKAVLLNGEFSSELLESIFASGTPLHDGAVILREKNIVAAAVILPLAEDTAQLAKSMGTRHRAGLGLSLLTDSLVIVISEETGKISIARDGIMTRGVKIDRFKGIIRSIYNPPSPISMHSKFNFKEWLKR